MKKILLILFCMPLFVVGQGWNQLGLDIDGESVEDRSGHAVAINGDGSIVAIGALSNDDNGTNSGHVRVYEYALGVWIQIGQDIDGETIDDGSGSSVALSNDGTILAVGAPYNSGNGINSGHVRVFQFAQSSGQWTQIGLDIDGEAAGDECGKPVEKMSKMGFVDVYNLDGGFMSWKEANLPYNIDSLFNYKSLDNILTQNYIDSILIVNTNVLICISTQWCMPCRKMEPIINKLEIELNDKLFVLRLDADDNPFLTKQYNVLAIPTYVLYKNNLEVWRKNGIIAYSELVRNIN